MLYFPCINYVGWGETDGQEQEQLQQQHNNMKSKMKNYIIHQV